MKKRLVIIGATGSVGTNVLDVVRKNPDDFTIMGLTAHSSTDELYALQQEFQPSLGVTCDVSDMLKMACDNRVDMLVFSCLGTEVRDVLLTGIKHKKGIAIATKELLVEYGREIMRKAKRHGVNVVPIDSEHSGIFQILENNKDHEIEKIILTCSGGPFLNTKREKFSNITFSQAIQHPNWNMGKKISVDSATMMNKALEIIEAHYLFDIEVLVHPQSIVHALVQFTDGATIAHIGYPDMRLPISYALYYPEKKANNLPRIDLADKQLDFYKPDLEKFPSIQYAYDALNRKGNVAQKLNRANEKAVKLFEKGDIGFDEIFQYVKNNTF